MDRNAMKTRVIQCAVVGLMVACLGLGTACKKQAGPVAVPAEASSYKLPGASNVFAALAEKNYEGTVVALTKAGSAARSQELQMEYLTLVREVRVRLMDVADKDPKAAAALDTLRVMSAGR
jgi:hypothetical protein